MLVLATAVGGLSACGGSPESSPPPETQPPTTPSVSTSAPAVSEPDDYYGMSLDHIGEVLGCQDINNKAADPDYKILDASFDEVGLCYTSDGHSSAVFVFKDERQQDAAFDDSTFQVVTNDGVEAPGVIVACKTAN